MVEDKIPWNTDGPLRLVLFNKFECIFEAEGYITDLSYGVTVGEPIEPAALIFKITGPLTKRFPG